MVALVPYLLTLLADAPAFDVGPTALIVAVVGPLGLGGLLIKFYQDFRAELATMRKQHQECEKGAATMAAELASVRKAQDQAGAVTQAIDRQTVVLTKAIEDSYQKQVAALANSIHKAVPSRE